MRITYYGQACTLIEAAGKKILTDPWLTEGAYFGTWFHTHLLEEAGVTPETFPKDIDYLFLSHEHQDHVDPKTLRHFSPDIPTLICQFSTSKFRDYLRSIGLKNILEIPSGLPFKLGGDATVTIFRTAEYTNDAALLLEAEGLRVLNETDCKLSYIDLKRIAQIGIDIGFYMFSGANWYPVMYEYSEDLQRELVRRRRHALLSSFIQRVRVTQPKIAVPSAGPCTVLDPERAWLNTRERGIFIDPEEAVDVLARANLGSQPLFMAATDVWDSDRGREIHAPESFRRPRMDYITAAMERMLPHIESWRASEPPAGSDLAERLVAYFNDLIASQTSFMRRRINAKVGLVVSGRQGGTWTLDFTSDNSTYVYEGLCSDWTYKMNIEDSLLYPFLTGEVQFFEDLLLSLRVRCARRPDVYNEPLYHFLYDPDPEKLHNWYAKD